MTESAFHSLFNVDEINDATELVIPRAIGIYNACKENESFNVLQLLRNTEKNIECIIVDVQCDGVPSKNSYGIKYRERLALCVPNNSKKLVKVLALRKDFPVLMHQHGTMLGSPISLCLYFEPNIAVNRSWTPENFLRRIVWWLEKSARGELHAADQPVEQLFFVTNYELVLPWNFEDLKNKPDTKFTISRGGPREDGSETFFLTQIKQDITANTLTPIEIDLPPIVHGQIERDPQTLGGLVDMLLRREVDLLPMLQKIIQDRVGQDGIPMSSDDPLSVILLHIPICRTVGDKPEKLVTRAFIAMTGLLSIGQKLGAIVSYNGTCFIDYKDALAPPGSGVEIDWRNERLEPIEVLHEIDVAASRFQSGIKDEGPDAVIVGAGSLGSTMLDLWFRSGWGQWTAIDKDHIKPHNLVRHIAYSSHIGISKTQAVAQIHGEVTNGSSKFVPINGDATDLNDDCIRALIASKLVVDASTTLDYPRMASSQDEFGRHVSVFVSPDGNAAVLLAEDESRKVRLRTLEAQYYRAIIEEAWGEHHLDGNLGTYWSGASCRDISMVMPYSRIVVHAATLAEQVRSVSNQQEARIQVWSRDPESGAIQTYIVPVFHERRYDFGNLELFIDEGLVQKLKSERVSKIPEETGGILLGYYDFNINAIIVVDALPAPIDSSSTVTSFERGVDGLQARVVEVARRTAGIVQYIGEWHSHPPGCSASPSKDDLHQLAYLSLMMSDDGLPAVSLIVGENEIRVMKGQA